MAVTEREGGRGRVLVSLLNPDSPSYSSGGGDNGVVMVTATACCPSSLEKILLAVWWLMVDTDLVYERKVLMAAG